MNDERHQSGRPTRKWVAVLLGLGAVLALILFAATERAVAYAGSDAFCATACHTMGAANESYRRGVHHSNPLGIPATCSDCHVLLESRRNKTLWQFVQLVAFKAKVGLNDVYHEALGTISTPEKWQAQRGRLSASVHAFVRQTNSSTCLGCHELSAFGAGSMHTLVHIDVINAQTVDCLECHVGMAHPDSVPVPAALANGGAGVSGTVGAPLPPSSKPEDAGVRALRPPAGGAAFWQKRDAAAGKALYAAKCGACHGGNGEGGTSPPLWGPRSFDGASSLAQPQTLTVFISSHMAGYAGGLTPEESRDLAAFIDSHSR